MKRKSVLTPMPTDFGISQRVRDWAARKGYGRLDDHLENFKLLAESRGYEYASWDAALMRAISMNYAKIPRAEVATRPEQKANWLFQRPTSLIGRQYVIPTGFTGSTQEARPGESMEQWQARIRSERH